MSSKIDELKELTDTLNQLQWFTPIKLKEIQTNKLRALVSHHVKNTVWFSDRIKESKLTVRDISADHMERLPLLTRRDIQSAGERFFAREIPKDHGKTGVVKTSGSTGEPVVIKATDIVGKFFHSYNYQEILWHNRDFKSRLATIRAGQFETKELPNWGAPYSILHETGPALLIHNATDIKEQARLLSEFKPDILLVYPNNLAALLDVWGDSVPKLTHIKCVGETVSDQLRERVKHLFHLNIEDSYSSQEVGSIANKCSSSDLYHTMDQNLIVEILDDNYNPCKEGEIGKIVITDLHNYATPMIRYSIGDYAERGGVCRCGRGLGTLKKVLGRERNLLVRADGSRYWPMIGMYAFDTLDFIIRKYQVIQHTVTDIEYKIVTDEAINSDQETALILIAQAALGPEYNIRITRYAQDWPLPPNGKFEEFVSKVS
jgi:phenylacetate-CoA ligase